MEKKALRPLSLMMPLFITLCAIIGCGDNANDLQSATSSNVSTAVDSTQYMPAMYTFEEQGFVDYDFCGDYVVEMLLNGPDEFIKSCVEPYSVTPTDFYYKHPEQADQLRELCEKVQWVPTVDDGFKKVKMIPSGLYAFEMEDGIVQPYFYTYGSENGTQYSYTYYSEKFWQWLKETDNVDERVEKTYRLKNGSAVDCLIMSSDGKVCSLFPWFVELYNGDTNYIWIKYNDMLIACSLSGDYHSWVYVDSQGNKIDDFEKFVNKLELAKITDTNNTTKTEASSVY